MDTIFIWMQIMHEEKDTKVRWYPSTPLWTMLMDPCIERLVHAPLSALMMLETLRLHHPDDVPALRSFKYRAINPMVVNKEMTIRGSWDSARESAFLWTVNEDGHVGMTGTMQFSHVQ
jgi:hypothetical protein